MRKNIHMGVVYFPVSGVGEVELCFKWSAIADLHGLYGKEWEKELQRICEEIDIHGLATVLAIGSQHDTEWWMNKSPPVIPAVQAMQEAIHIAFFGAGGTDTKRPPVAHRLKTLFSRAFKFGSGPVGEKTSSLI